METPSGPPRVKTCSRCGASFGCGPAEGREGCWCEELPHVLPFTGEDCLCPACARAEIERWRRANPAREAP